MPLVHENGSVHARVDPVKQHTDAGLHDAPPHAMDGPASANVPPLPLPELETPPLPLPVLLAVPLLPPEPLEPPLVLPELPPLLDPPLLLLEPLLPVGPPPSPEPEPVVVPQAAAQAIHAAPSSSNACPSPRTHKTSGLLLVDQYPAAPSARHRPDRERQASGVIAGLWNAIFHAPRVTAIAPPVTNMSAIPTLLSDSPMPRNATSADWVSRTSSR
jgi:hypothetical protein